MVRGCKTTRTSSRQRPLLRLTLVAWSSVKRVAFENYHLPLQGFQIPSASPRNNETAAVRECFESVSTKRKRPKKSESDAGIFLHFSRIKKGMFFLLQTRIFGFWILDFGPLGYTNHHPPCVLVVSLRMYIRRPCCVGARPHNY